MSYIIEKHNKFEHIILGTSISSVNDDIGKIIRSTESKNYTREEAKNNWGIKVNNDEHIYVLTTKNIIGEYILIITDLDGKIKTKKLIRP